MEGENINHFKPNHNVEEAYGNEAAKVLLLPAEAAENAADEQTI